MENKNNNCKKLIWKALLVIGMVSMLLNLIAAIILAIVTGNEELPKWEITWIMLSMGIIFLSGLVGLITYWKDFKLFIIDEFSCT